MIYMDNAATSWSKPKQVYMEMVYCMKYYGANPGRSGHKMAMMAGEKIYECRENISRLFSISDPLSIIFACNTTDALNLGIKGILKSGDHVIITSMEHNSVLRPIKKLEQNGIELSVIQADITGKVDPSSVETAIRQNTKLIIATHASNVCGTINPIKEIGDIAKKNHILFMLDAAQTAGVYPIDVEKLNVDLLAFPGHKGLLGPQGTGGLYVKNGIELDTLKEGGTGSLSESPYQPDFTPDRYESGTLNTPGIAGLNEGVKYILDRGVDAIAEHERELVRVMLEGLNNISNVKVYGSNVTEERVGVVSFNIQGKDCVEICAALDDQYQIAARGGLHCSYLAHKTLGTLETGTVRLSVGIFNTKKEIDKVLKAVEELAKE